MRGPRDVAEVAAQLGEDESVEKGILRSLGVRGERHAVPLARLQRQVVLVLRGEEEAIRQVEAVTPDGLST